MELITSLLLAYFLGSIPFGLLLTRAAGLGDIRNIGSGNIGATNVMRSGNKKLGIATLFLDAGKGALPVLLAKHNLIAAPEIYLVALAAVLGHVFSLWLKFKGGKGVATAIGTIFAIDASVGVIFCLLWLTGLLFVRYVSLASIESFWLLALMPLLKGNLEGFLFMLSLAILITWTHRANIKRLRAGTEPRFGKKKP